MPCDHNIVLLKVVGPKKVGKSTIVEKNLKQSKEKATILYEDEGNNRGMA